MFEIIKVAAVVGVVAAVSAPASAAVIHCTSEAFNIFWQVSPTPSAQFWENGQWSRNVCSDQPRVQPGYECQVYPERYVFTYWHYKAGKGTATERWDINRSTGKVVRSNWQNEFSPWFTKDYAGICLPSAAPVAPTPKF